MNDNFKKNSSQYMKDRRGIDELGKFIVILIVLCLVIAILLESALLYYAVTIGITYSLFRIFSKNISKREEENKLYLMKMERLFKSKKEYDAYSTDNLNFRFFVCPSCGQEMRAPKGKGKIRVVCSKCSKVFETEV